MTNPQIQSEEAYARVQTAETAETELENLALQGFNEEEIMSLLWLRQWYQHGGSDRVEIVRRLEFLKQMVLQGQIEL
ncbi:MAG TPA: hypothetical protein VKV19_00325 [Ktedonobacteraceae bacterium]|nr:hypothetical protein [Ktedonobacteraceae bacterium]